MGIFGNVTESVANMSNAMRQFYYRPSLATSGNIMKESFKMIYLPLHSSFANFFSSIGHFVNPSEANQYSQDEESNHDSNMQAAHDKDLFEDDIA
jgi:hypothetical protein